MTPHMGIDSRKLDDNLDDNEADLLARIYTVIAAIPAGRVASYGDIAQYAGLQHGARRIGRVLSQLPADSKLPWWRVVTTQGRITCPTGERARKKLQLDGVLVNQYKVDMRIFRWQPEQ